MKTHIKKKSLNTWENM